MASSNCNTSHTIPQHSRSTPQEPASSRFSLEELEEILKHVRQNSATDLLNCLVTCQAWLDIGYPVLCRDVVLTSTNLQPFVNTFGVRHGKHIRSLTVHISGSTAGFSSPTAPFGPLTLSSFADIGRYTRDFERLAAMLPHFGNLQTFSTLWGTLNTARPMPRYSLNALVLNLPISVKNLEIDTAGHDRFYHHPTEPQHLCLSLRGVLPQLRNLRLRVKELCPCLFGGCNDFSAPNLERLLINVEIFSYYSAAVCHPNPYPVHEAFPNTEARGVLLPHLQSLLRSGAFPKIKELFVLDQRRRAGLDWREYSAVVVRDVLRDMTTSLPYLSAPAFSDACMIRAPDGRDLWGPEAASRDFAEGEAGWITTSKGSRFPGHVKFIHTKLNDGYKVLDLPWTRVDSFAERQTSPLRIWGLWKQELQVGMQLLEVQIRDGVLEDLAHLEKLPSGWQYDDTRELVPWIPTGGQQP
ncbi:hypothetical protein W97_07058 [Coniosporium apollinis CBS 100218]|uniref:F-box domain-containing protein n=1 Tax=Coniosporium apollinis (strain CBS 100218) TaxID=1168221 RepID=R7Z133_CONA1|nr:uncharacterized protein W97_07058 [Coniosporium apollinis CBS 100218]EON67803.1 hypothetical protein W97_07058 [Coniosporium apollinis CBS 100218]